MSIGVALGGFGQGLREGYALGKDIEETRRRRRAEKALAEAMASVAKPGDVVGSRNVAKSADQYAQDNGILMGALQPGGRLNNPADVQGQLNNAGVAFNAPTDIQAVPTQSITAGLKADLPTASAAPPNTGIASIAALPVQTAAGLPVPEMLRQEVEQALPRPPSETQTPAAQAPVGGEPRVQQAAPQQPQVVTFKDPITGQVRVTDRPRTQTTAGYVRAMAEAYMSVEDPDYRDRGIAMLAQAEQLQAVEDQRARTNIMRSIMTNGMRWAAGDSAAGEAMARDWEDFVPDGLTPRLQTNQDGSLTLQMLDTDTGIAAGDMIQFANRNEALSYMFAIVSPEMFPQYLQESRETRREIQERARADFQMKLAQLAENRAAELHPLQMDLTRAQIGAVGRQGRGGGGGGGDGSGGRGDVKTANRLYNNEIAAIHKWARDNNISPGTPEWDAKVRPYEELAENNRDRMLGGGSAVDFVVTGDGGAPAGPLRPAGPEAATLQGIRTALGIPQPVSPYGEMVKTVASPVGRAGTAVVNTTLRSGEDIVEGVSRVNPFMPRR